MFCEKCGKQLLDGSTFCDGCGAPVSKPPVKAAPVESEVPVEPTAPVEATTAAVAKKPLNTKTLIGIGAVAVVIILIILIIALISGGGSDAPLLYVTDGELVYNANIEKNTTFTIDEKYLGSDVSYSYYYDTVAGCALESYSRAAFTEDYKKFVFLGNYDSDDYTYTLYWAATKNLEKGTDSVTKVASGVSLFRLASEADALIYLKGNKLYYYDFKNDPVLISKDISFFWNDFYMGAINFLITENGKYVCYGKEGDEYTDLYVYDVNAGEAEKIDSDVIHIYYYDTENSFETMLYSKSTDDTETLYRGGRGNEKEKLISKVAEIFSADPNGYCFYKVAGDDGYELYCYDMATSEKVELTDEFRYYYTANAADGVIVYTEGDTVLDVTWLISVAGGKPTEVDELVTAALVSDDGKTLYTIETEEGDDEGELVSYTIGSDSVSNRTKLADDVYPYYLNSFNGFVCYLTDYDTNDDTGTLYVLDGEESTQLVDEVYYLSLSATEDGFVFYADPDDDECTLYLYDGKTAIKVATDACRYGCAEYDGGLLYLTDFDEEDGGTLYLWDGKNKTKIASDVQTLIPVE
jgi:hypothetical protein